MLRDGRTLRGFARARGSHDLQLQTFDGTMHLLSDKEYSRIAEEKASLMPAAQAQPDLVAFLSTLGGVTDGAIKYPVDSPAATEFEALLHPRPGEWPSYYGTLN